VRFVSLKTLSKKHDISVSQLRRFIKLGLSHYRVKGKILVDPDEFEKWFSNEFKVVNEKPIKKIEDIVSNIISEYRSDSP